MTYPLVTLSSPQAGFPQSARDIPVVAAVDVVVVGGTVAGVAAANAAARCGAKVFLIAPFPYLGEDLCATLRLARPPGEASLDGLAAQLFASGSPATPGQVKATLARTLVEAGVDVVYQSYATDVVRASDGQLGGVIMANRGGRQAVLADVVIDATDYAWLCRLAGCAFAPWSGGVVRIERSFLRAVSPSDELSATPAARGETLAFDVELPDWSFASLLRAERRAREKTPVRGVLRTAARIFCVPPTQVYCRRSRDMFSGDLRQLDTGHFQPRDEERLFVLGGCADLPRAAVAELLQPGAMAGVGDRVGRLAAAQAGASSQARSPVKANGSAATDGQGEVREILSGGGFHPLSSVACESTELPLLAEADVVVVGGGVSGVAAAIASARRGVRTLVVEPQEGLGGMGTVGLIATPYHGKKVGFAKSVPFPNHAESKMRWYRNQLVKQGGEVWFGAFACGALVEDDTIVGVVVATPQGRGTVRAKVVVDATGNADVALAAGAAAMFGDLEAGDIALQGVGLAPWNPGKDHSNSDCLLVDEMDMRDVWRALTSAYLASQGEYDVTPLIQSRERHRVVGDFMMRYVDQIAGRTYPDTVAISQSDYDSHGYPSSPLFALLPHDEASRKANHPAPGGGVCHTPYRCLLPKGLDGILVCGLGIGMERDASAMMRMQLDLANQGYAVGLAAAMAAASGVPPRRIDVRALQRHLVEMGNLPAEVLRHEDSFPLPQAQVEQAVRAYGKATNPAMAGTPLGILLSHPALAREPLKQAYRTATGRAKVLYAQTLAALGEAIGFDTLMAALAEVDGWDEKICQGRMADFAYLPTPVDALILALGWVGDRSAVPALVERVRLLDADVTLSHHRSLALALERLADPAAAEALAELLAKPGMQGHAMTRLPPADGPLENRVASLREITLARALYHCGDHRGLGRRILQDYARDLRGLFARHAQALCHSFIFAAARK